MAALSSESARTEVSSPAGPRNQMCRHRAGSEPGGEGRADIVKLHQAIEARLGSSVKLGKRAKKALGSFDVMKPFSYHPPEIGVKPVLGRLRLEIFKKRTQSGIAMVKNE